MYRRYYEETIIHENTDLKRFPRKNGDTASLLRILKKNLTGDVKVVDAYCNVAPCVDCRYCWKNPGCCVKDEMQGNLCLY